MPHQTSRPTLLTILLAITLAARAAHADVINVPADYPTIQQAIDASVNGDEIVVQPGTYHETIEIDGRSITLRSARLPLSRGSAICLKSGAASVIKF